MTFELEDFLKAPSVENLETLRVRDLVDVCKHFNLYVRKDARKHELYNQLVRYMVNNEILDESALDSLKEDVNANLIRIRELELQREREKEENELKMRELEIQRV